MTLRRVLVSGVVAASCCAVACSSSSSADERAACPAQVTPASTEPAPLSATSFTAFAQNFAGFRSWTSKPGISTHVGGTGLHGDTAMTVYINRVPPPGSAEFPVGTVIVKESNDGDVRDRQLFAMVKRGGGFNASGAKGWEWFELEGRCNDEPIISWRGVGPPAGEKYGGDANGGCNACHANQAENDFVRTDGLALSSF